MFKQFIVLLYLLASSEDWAIRAASLGKTVGAESAAVGGAVPALAAVKGTAVGSALSTPIILKAVALPGIAAGKTAAFMSGPALIDTLKTIIPQQLGTGFEHWKIDDLGHDFSDLFVVEDSHHLEDEDLLGLNKGVEHIAETAGLLKAGADGLKAGALGLATKGVLLAKKGAYVAGRIILKPIAIIAGANLKVIGTGLAIGGKLIGGTGAGIAKAGTAVKYAGLGSIGLGASAIGWGLDKTTIDTHFKESQSKFESLKTL